jgi:hypothetical protein
MAQLEMCRCCGQPLPPKNREGVHLPAKKACIYDFIRDHPGVTLAGIRAQCFADGTNVKTVHVHINQINSLMAGTDVQIKGEKLGGVNEPGTYRIVRKAAVRKWRKAKRR